MTWEFIIIDDIICVYRGETIVFPGIRTDTEAGQGSGKHSPVINGGESPSELKPQPEQKMVKHPLTESVPSDSRGRGSNNQ